MRIVYWQNEMWIVRKLGALNHVTVNLLVAKAPGAELHNIFQMPCRYVFCPYATHILSFSAFSATCASIEDPFGPPVGLELLLCIFAICP